MNKYDIEKIKDLEAEILSAARIGARLRHPDWARSIRQSLVETEIKRLDDKIRRNIAEIKRIERREYLYFTKFPSLPTAVKFYSIEETV